jgi:hypothetical protein
VTLNEVATALLVQIQSLLGFSPEFIAARGDLVISSFRDLLTVSIAGPYTHLQPALIIRENVS